ncbi:hypothetical protein D3C81_1829390 [compost metagenome]
MLSGNVENVVLMEAIIAEVGDDPDRWLPELQDRVYEEKVKRKAMVEYGNDPAVWAPIVRQAMQERRRRRDAIPGRADPHTPAS